MLVAAVAAHEPQANQALAALDPGPSQPSELVARPANYERPDASDTTQEYVREGRPSAGLRSYPNSLV